MNVNEATHQTFLPACGSYDAQLWPGWRQDACYPPYYATGSEPSFPCNSSATFMHPQRFEFPLMPSHHPPFELSQPMQQHSQQAQPSQPAISSSISSSSSSSSASSSAEPSSSTPHGSHTTDQITSSYNSPDNQPTSSSKPTSDYSSEIDSTKESGVSLMKEETLLEPSHIKQEATSSDCTSTKKKRDRFNGLTEEDVLKRTVPDLLAHNLDIIIIGSCPGLTAAYLGHHYAGPGNHFWKCLYLSRLIPEPMNASDDFKLKQFGIGFTNFVARCTKGSVEFSRREIKEGIESLTEKIQNFKPKIAVFNGKGIYEVFCNHKNFYIGKQPEMFPGTNTVVYVMPSSSARCSQLPRASDKVPFFVALRKLRDHLMGTLPHLDESEIVFPDLDLKVEPRKDRRSSDDVSSAAHSQPHTRPSSREDRKRKMMECHSTGFGDVMAAQRMMYRGFVPHQDFNGWGSPGCFPGWPHPTLGLPSHPHQYPNYDAAFASMTNVPPAADPCGFFRNIHSSPFYPGWSGETQHHRWAVTHPHFPGTSSVPDPRYNIPPYFQSFAPSDMLSAAAMVRSNKKEAPPSSFALPIPFLDACRPHQLDHHNSTQVDARSQSFARMQFQARMFAQRPSSSSVASNNSSSIPVNPYQQTSHQSYAE